MAQFGIRKKCSDLVHGGKLQTRGERRCIVSQVQEQLFQLKVNEKELIQNKRVVENK